MELNICDGKRLLKFRKYVDVMTKYPKDIKKLDTIMQTKLEKMSFSQFDWDILELLLGVLKVFHLSTSLISGRKYSTISITYFVHANIEFFLTKQSSGKYIIYQDILKQRIYTQYQKYFNTNITKTQKEKTLIAAYLDPMIFAEIPDSDQPGILKLTLDQLKKCCAHESNETNKNNHDQDKSSEAVEEETNDKNGMKVLSALSGRKLKNTNRELTLNEELTSYSSSNKIDINGETLSFESYWKTHHQQYPKLAKFACFSNVMAATSVPSESSFSVAGYLLRKERARLSPKQLKYSMIFRDKSLVEELCETYSIKR